MGIAERPQLQPSPLVAQCSHTPSVLRYTQIQKCPCLTKCTHALLRKIPPKLHAIMYPGANPASLGDVRASPSSQLCAPGFKGNRVGE